MSYTGTKLGQDIRFKDPDKGILSSMKTPKIFSTTVRKRNIIILPIIKLWLNKKIIELLEFEDETLVNLIINLISSSEEKIDPKKLQYQISGFLGDKTYSFMKQFWKLLISVQECYLQDESKIPDELIIFKIEYEKNKQKNKHFERYREYYEDDYNKNKIYENKNQNDYEDNTKIELMKVIDSYKNDEKYKTRNKSRSRSRSRSHHHHKRKYRSRSREYERERRKEMEEYEYKYKSNSRSKRRSRRKKSKSSSSMSNKKERNYKKEREDYNNKEKDRRRKYSKDSSSSSSIMGYDDYKKKRNRSDSSDSSETFKI